MYTIYYKLQKFIFKCWHVNVWYIFLLGSLNVYIDIYSCYGNLMYDVYFCLNWLRLCLQQSDRGIEWLHFWGNISLICLHHTWFDLVIIPAFTWDVMGSCLMSFSGRAVYHDCELAYLSPASPVWDSLSRFVIKNQKVKLHLSYHTKNVPSAWHLW